jgi:hypothetical protein
MFLFNLRGLHMPTRLLILLLLITTGVTACATPPAGPEPAPVTHTYALPGDALVLNPERGFFAPYNLPGAAGFSPVRITGKTLVHVNIRLDPWRASDIPQDVLDGLSKNFASIRAAGVKVIIRFAYNDGPYPDSEPDASKEYILRHIQQLTPLLQDNADVIAWMEAGFIGAWGEWHTSTNGLDNPTDKKDILFALLDALPQTRTVQVRYPTNIIQIYPDVLTSEQAFTGTRQARTAHHNDCFLSSDTDVGTYERDGVITFDSDRAYLAELTRFTPMSGETCAPYPPRSECASALQEMELLHVTSLNESYHKGILLSWEKGGCYDQISSRLGYLLTLTSAAFNQQVRPGGVLNLTVNLENTGFGAMINERPLYVVLDTPPGSGGKSKRYAVRLEAIDPRRWEPGTVTLAVKLHVPSNAPLGEYRLALWLPDAYESLRDDPRYAVRFANGDVWDKETGLNLLGNITLSRSAGGVSETGKDFSVIAAAMNVVRR